MDIIKLSEHFAQPDVPQMHQILLQITCPCYPLGSQRSQGLGKETFLWVCMNLRVGYAVPQTHEHCKLQALAVYVCVPDVRRPQMRTTDFPVPSSGCFLLQPSSQV